MKRPDISIAEFKRDAGSVTVSMKEAILDYIEYLEQRANTLPDSIQEALNSGDGVYRP